MRIKGKYVWITGASSGIGEALASELFRRGANIIISARNVDKLNTLKEGLDLKEAGRCMVLPCDITNHVEMNAAVAVLKTMVPRLDILVNNAGVSQRSYALETDIIVDRSLFEVNFFGAIHITKAVLPWMIEQGGGHVVVISSMAGKFGFRMRSAYAASKHALQGFFETLRAEVHDKHVQVLLVCPGRINTPISIHSLVGNGNQYGKMDEGQANGVPVDKCARIIARSIERNRKEVFIGGSELFLLVVKRVCPPLFYFIVNRINPT